MATIIKLKRGTTTPTTSNIVNGEVAVDTSAQKLYINDSGSIKEIGGGGNTFTTININDTTDVVADSTSDTLNLDSTGLISISGNASTDTITVGTVSSATIPFLKADGSSSNIDLYTSGTIGQVITNLYIPFTTADGTSVSTLVVA